MSCGCWSHRMGLKPKSPDQLRGSATLGLLWGCRGHAVRRSCRQAHGSTYNLARQGELQGLRAPTAHPPLPPPGPLRPELARSAAGKCYFVGKVSAGTARISAAVTATQHPGEWGRPPRRGLRLGAGGSGRAPRGPRPSLFPPPPLGPRLLVRPRAQPGAPSRRVEVVAGGTGRRWPRQEWGASGLRPGEQRREGAQPDGQAVATHRSPGVSTWTRAVVPSRASLSARCASRLPARVPSLPAPPGAHPPPAWRLEAATSRRVAGAARGWGRRGEAGGGLCTD